MHADPSVGTAAGSSHVDSFGSLALQSITIPSSERGGGLRIFTFALTSVASDKLQGTFDCVRQPGGGSR